jgi:hypothetical protein
MGARSWLAIALSVGFVGVGACSVGLYLWARPFFARRPTASDQVLTWTDRYEVLDTRQSHGYRYVLVRVWTTVPDLMQRVDLYCYGGRGLTGEPTRASLRRSRQVLSENLDDHFRRTNEDGRYTVRWPKRGTIDLGQKSITIEFDTGAPQAIAIPEAAVRARCPASAAQTGAP